MQHAQAMKMHRSTVVLDGVFDVNDYCITPASFDKGARELAIHNLCNFWVAIRAGYFLRDLEIELEKVT
jgi:hypothetical protein